MWPMESTSRKRTVSLCVNGIGAMLATSTASAVRPAVDEADGLPGLVDRDRLVVDEPGLEPDALDIVEGEVGLELRRLLRPRDPETVGLRERALQVRKAAAKLVAARREEDGHVGARLGAEL